MKPKLKLGFTDTHDHLASFFYHLLSTRYDIELNNEDPEFLIFGDDNFGRDNLNFSRDKVTKIFFTGENRRPEDYDCHYAITFDHNHSQWHYRLPLFVVYMWALETIHKTPYKYDYIMNPQVKEKSGFCSFVVSNPNCKERNDFFQALHKVKSVDAGGKLFKNVDIELPDEQSKINFLSTRKFNICFESASYPGYVTEKILHAFYAGTIPIYWGSPTVALDFNTHSFINVHEFKSIDHVIDYVLKCDENEDLYQNILRQPKFSFNVPPSYIFLNNFLNWFDAMAYKKVGARKHEDTYILV